jgi:hypothetical protein
MAQNGLEGILNSIEVLSRSKLQAESRAKLINSMHKDEEISASDHRRMATLYEGARADVNSGVDRLLVELEASDRIDSEDSFEKIASRAARQVETFVAESDLLVFGEDRSVILEGGLSLAGTIIGALVDVWKNIRGARTAWHTKLVERLDGLRWSAFENF